MNAIAQPQPDRSGSPDSAVLLAAVQASPESLAITASGVIVYANPAWCEMFECGDPRQLHGRRVEQLLPALPVAGKRARGVDSDAPFFFTRRDGTGLHLEIDRAGFRLRGREFQVIHARDVTRQREAEQQVLGAQRAEAVGRLVGGVAHDFNNLLTGIMLYCDLLIGDLKKDSRPYRYALEMRAAGENGAALVQQLLALARPRAEESRVFALNDVVTGVEDLLARLIGENIVLTTSLDPDLGAVRMDPAQVQQILLNLVLNARDAMPDGGRIALTTQNSTDPRPFGLDAPSQIGQWVELTVTDTGCGMDVETLGHAFEPFFTTKKLGRGTGLGLATALRLAWQEGGTITAESEPGKGTRVSLHLPRAQAHDLPNSKAKEVIHDHSHTHRS